MAIDVESLPDLEVLHDLLRRENMAHSPEVWLYIHQLLANRAAQGRLPQNTAEFASLLSPLVCKNPQHQYRMQAVISEWLSGKKNSVQAQITSSEHPTAIAWRQRLRQFNRRTLYGVAVLLLLLISLALGFYFYQPTPIPKPLPVTVDKPVASTPAASEASVAPITSWVDPNPLPMPEQLPANWQALQQILGKGIPALPAGLALPWLIWHYRKRTVLRNNAPQGEKILSGLNFDLAKDNAVAPFSGADFAKAAAKLLYPVWTTSRRLHIGDSVIATAQNSGLFTPRYQQRHERPQYLILVQSVHGDDQTASYAELLVKALQQQKVDIRSYRFRDDPRRLIPNPKLQPLHGADKSPISLAQLAQKYSDARLIVVSDWNILFQPYYPDRRHEWVKEFDNWVKRVWLSPGYEDEQWAKRAEQQAKDLNFCLLPLASESINDITRWFQLKVEPPKPLIKIHDDNEHLPAILSETADSWLDWRPPHGMDLKQLCQALQKWLGQDGFLLLQALAVFPKPLSPLPQILDIQLSSMTSSPLRTGSHEEKHQRLDRENRLQRISRLPWLRFAYMPDYLRLRLLKTLKRSEREKIRLAWTAILGALTAEENPEKISVPIHLPEKGKVKVKALLASQPKNSALNDAIFANIIMGGKLGLLDFSLPRALAGLFPNTDKWLDFRPALAVLVLAGISVWGVDWLWQSKGQDWVIKHWQQQIERQNADWQVQVVYQTDTQQLSKVLANTLQAEKFRALQMPTNSAERIDRNAISYASGGKYQAEQVAQALAWLSYSATIDLVENPALAKNTLQVQLRQTYQHSAGFKDELRFPMRKPFEPEMVMIPAGSFLMGSMDAEKNSSDDERPQHKVTIAKPFALGKYEVTFAEYDAFAKATKRKLPDDSGWGRDKRPVINVSFDDAQAYTEWLSKQTGKAYRLPTEAEWEYAARAGTSTAYYWGNSIDCAKGNYGYNDCKIKKTTVAGSYPANPWGLYDMAGNVWEWNSDCWHENYKGAPDNGAAWLKEQGGDCVRRVVRGGSWNSFPQFLRSANRGGVNTDGAINYRGFRVARAL